MEPTPAALLPAGSGTGSASIAAVGVVDCSVHTEYFCVTLGSRNKTLRFVDNKKLLQWGVEALDCIAPAPAM